LSDFQYEPAMPRTLSEEDVDSVARRVVKLMAERLAVDEKQPGFAGSSPPAALSEKAQLPTRIAYTAKQLSAELGLSPVSIYRLEARGLIKSLPGIRHKIFSQSEVQRLLTGDRDESKLRRRMHPRSPV
jgi:hypothetical protein